MISLMVAKSKNGCIGLNETLPWKQRNDLQRFKAMTIGRTIVVGRTTFASFGYRPLPDRAHWIFTRDADNVIDEMLARGIDFNDHQDSIFFLDSLEDITNSAVEPIICGGASIYSQAIEAGIVDVMYITEIDADIDGDTFFPAVDMTKWKLVASESYTKDEHNQYDYKFLTYKKITSRLI